MTAPVFIGQGALGAGVGAVPYPYPTQPYNGTELLLVAIEDANEGATPTPPAGWTLVTGTPVGTGTAAGTTSTAIRLYYKWASPGDIPSASGNFGDLGDHQVGCMLSVDGVDPTTPFDVAAVTGTAASSGSVTFPSITTVTNACLVICFVADATDTLTAQGSSFAHAGLTGVGSGTVTSNQGNGGGISYLYGVRSSFGATGTGSCSLQTASVQALLTIALRPNQQSIATVSKINSYAIVDGAVDAVGISKLQGYAITESNVSFSSLSKLAAYAVTETIAAARPVVFVCT